MSVAKVLELREYRDRRQHRLKLAKALYRMDPGRRDLTRHLAEIAAVCGADRVATVWVDEYGPGLVHPYALIDLIADRPRRSFSLEPLRRAWEIGVPGAHDEVVPAGGTGQSTFAISLGSDGARAWFVVADSVSPRPPLGGPVRDRVMFLAGECSAVALHRDLDVTDGDEQDAEARFAGWPILKDLEGREDDEPVARRIAQRFVMARIIRTLVDNDLVLSDERAAELVQGARRDLAADEWLGADERASWSSLLDRFEERAHERMAELLLELADGFESRGHRHGAKELYLCAYGLAVMIGHVEVAVESARFLGRLHRRQAMRDEATEWYRAAYRIAAAARIDHLAALSLSGIATTRQERGNVPGARELMVDALALAERSGDGETVATMHRTLLTIERSAGDAAAALKHGWLAVGASEAGRDRTRCLATLAGTLQWAGDLEVAADAWRVVAETTDELYLEIFALDALGHVAALRGDVEAFHDYSTRCDALGHESLLNAHAQILYYRGLSFRALGMYDEAADWLRRAVGFAEEHGFSELIFKAESDLEGLANHVVERAEPTPAAPPSVREGVRAMRQELVGATS